MSKRNKNKVVSLIANIVSTVILIFSILIFGVYGPEYNAAAFIYFAF